jgi:hypothetical protein
MRLQLSMLLFISLSVSAQKNAGMDSLIFKAKIETAKLVDLNQILTFWLLNDYRDPREPRLREFHSDSTFHFFSRSGKSYKIYNSEISKINYRKINGDSLTNHFFDHVIPVADRTKGNNCGSAVITPTYKCSYIDQESIKIYCHYNIICDLFPVLNRTYAAIYNLKNLSFNIIPATPPSIKK